LFLLKLISKKLSRKKGKINTIQHGQGEKHTQRIFMPSKPPAKVEQLIAWPRREKMKTQGEKKDTGKKIKTRGKNKDRGKKYHIFSPSWNTQLRYCHKKRLCSAGKIWFDFPLAIFSPRYTVCKSRKIIAWPKGEKNKDTGRKISYIFPQLDF
jgi:hypothetical protein